MEQYLAVVKAKKAALASMTRKNESETFQVGPGSGGGLYISQMKSDGTAIHSVQGIDIDAARFIIETFIDLYGDEVKP